MRALVQRVTSATVSVDAKTISQIGAGLLVFVGIHTEDTEKEGVWLAHKVANLRIFRDENDKMNLSLLDTGGAILVVSQFTLYGKCVSGRRPDFLDAAKGPQAEALYEGFVKELLACGLVVETGTFGAYMQVSLTNDGPVTLLVETPSQNISK